MAGIFGAIKNMLGKGKKEEKPREERQPTGLEPPRIKVERQDTSQALARPRPAPIDSRTAPPPEAPRNDPMAPMATPPPTQFRLPNSAAPAPEDDDAADRFRQMFRPPPIRRY